MANDCPIGQNASSVLAKIKSSYPTGVLNNCKPSIPGAGGKKGIISGETSL
jgi:hypothetical protein